MYPSEAHQLDPLDPYFSRSAQIPQIQQSNFPQIQQFNAGSLCSSVQVSDTIHTDSHQTNTNLTDSHDVDTTSAFPESSITT